jgi:competence protein ComEC
MGQISVDSLLTCYFPHSISFIGIILVQVLFIIRKCTLPVIIGIVFVMLLVLIVLFLFLNNAFYSITGTVSYQERISCESIRVNKNKRNFLVVLLVVIFLMTLIRCLNAIVFPYMNCVNPPNHPISIEGKIISVSISNEMFLKTEIVVLTSYGKIYLFDRLNDLECGDHFVAEMTLHKIPSQRNPGGFNAEDYYHRRGIFFHGIIYNQSIHRIDKPSDLFRRTVYRIRKSIIKRYHCLLPSRDAGLLSGFVLGEKSTIDTDLSEKLRKSGIAHLTAVSGTAISCLYTPIIYLSGMIKVRRKVRSGIIILILSGLGFLAGWTPSVTRALFMLFTVMLSRVLFRKVTTFQSLVIAIFAMILIHPIHVLSAGFYFSIFATCGIIHLNEPIKRFIKRRIIKIEWIASGIAISIAAGIGIVPLMVFYSEEVSLTAFLSNFITMPFAHISILLGFFIGISDLALNDFFLNRLLVFPLKGALGVISMIADLFSKPEMLRFRIEKFYLSWMMIAFLLCVFLFIYTRVPKKIVAAMLIITGLSFLAYHPILFILKPDMRVVFIDVGQGDATLIILKSGESVLIDSGGEKRGYTAVKGVLDHYGIRSPTLYIATHAHEDHCGGMPWLFENCGGDTLILPIYTLEYSDFSQNDSIKEKDIAKILVFEASKNNIAVHYVGDKDLINIKEKLQIKILNPLYENHSSDLFEENRDANEISLVLLVNFMNHKILIMGDAVDDTERRIAETESEISESIFRISHHGSPKSTNHDIINAVNPLISIISVGYNSYGHPSKKVIQRLQDAGSRVLRTDQHGAVIIDFYGNRIVTRTMLKG